MIRFEMWRRWPGIPGVAAAALVVMMSTIGCERSTCPVQDRGITEIVGDVSLYATEDMAAMAGVRRIDGNLTISGYNMESLAGLDQLHTVTGTLKFTYLPQLQDFGHLGNLRRAGRVEVYSIRHLRSLEWLERLEECEAFSIHRCDSLTALGNVPAYRSAQNISLQNLPSLADITPLAAAGRLEELELYHLDPEVDLAPVSALRNLASLYLTDLEVAALPDLAPLQSLSFVNLLKLPQLSSVVDLMSGAPLLELVISDCPQLTSLDGLGATGNLSLLSLKNCPDLTSLEGAGELWSLESFQIDDCGVTSLTPLGTLSQLQTILLGSCPVDDLSALAQAPNLRQIRLWDLPELTDLASLPPLHAYQEIILENCRGLDSIAGLRLAESAKLYIGNCPALTAAQELQGLENLRELRLKGTGPTTIDLTGVVSLRVLELERSTFVDLADFAGLRVVDYLSVWKNYYLTDASHLGDLTAGYRVTISDNRRLDQCAVEAMAAGWEVAGTLTIENNGPCAP